jgi:hypothetical protein
LIVASKLPNGLDIGGFVLRPAMLGHEPHQKARAPGRERIAGYEITRGVPDDLWLRWVMANTSSPIFSLHLVEGFEDGDEEGLREFCHAYRNVRGWAQMPQS